MSIPRLHIIIDNYSLAEKAINGGAKLIQYRKKNFSYKNDIEELKKIREITKQNDVILIINDFPGLAMEINADGVHVGIEDTPLQTLKENFPHNKIIGFSVHNLEELAIANKFPEIISYIGVGSVFPSPTKKVKLLSSGKFEQICKQSKFPVIAIGGITTEKICYLLQKGAYGVAVISAFTKTPDPINTVVNMLTTINNCVPAISP